jgi:hypothetical protein
VLLTTDDTDATPSVTYQPGRQLLFVSAGRVLLVEDGGAPAAEIWQAFREAERGTVEFLASIGTTWIIIDAAGTCRTNSRIPVTVNWPQGSQTLDDEVSIGEALASSPASLRIGTPSSLTGQELSIVEGVVLADSVTIELGLGTPPAPLPSPIAPSEPDAEEMQPTIDRREVLPASADRLETVLAATCPAGHLSPAYAPQCRVCGLGISPQEPQTIARPVLGRLLLPDHETVDLDRPVIFGRSPQLLDERGERPHLINISRYGDYLSRMHLEVSLQGWHVLARDLGSTSGTTLTLPGREPESLRPDEPVVLEPGSVLDLAASYVLRFEV